MLISLEEDPTASGCLGLGIGGGGGGEGGLLIVSQAIRKDQFVEDKEEVADFLTAQSLFLRPKDAWDKEHSGWQGLCLFLRHEQTQPIFFFPLAIPT